MTDFFDRLFGESVKPHAFASERTPTPVDYGSLKAPSINSTGIDTEDQFLCSLFNVSPNTKIFENVGDPSSQNLVLPIVGVSMAGAQGSSIAIGQFSRFYDWCLPILALVTAGDANRIGIRYTLGSVPVSGWLPIGEINYVETVVNLGAGINSVQRISNGAGFPMLHPLRFDGIQVIAYANPAGTTVQASIIAFVGRGPTNPVMWNY